MNLDKLRQGNYSKIFINFVNRNSHKLIAGDQDVLNIVLSNKIKIINPKWNTTSYLFVVNNYKKCNLSKKLFNTCTQNPSIVHFDGIKPWISGSSHPYKKIFFKYIKKTEFKDYKIKPNLKKFLFNQVFYLGNKIANLLPQKIYNLVEKQYLKNNFLEKRYQQIIKNETK